MPLNYQFGSEHYLYIAQTSGIPTAITSRSVAGGNNFNEITDFVLMDNVRDVNESQNNNSVNITTRDDARQGLSINVIATTEAGLTFEVLYKPNNGATVQDESFLALLVAARTKKEIAAVDLDSSKTTLGAQGQAGNWNVAMSRSKPVEGVVTATVTMNLSSFGDFVKATDTSGTAFHRMEAAGTFAAFPA